MISLSLRIRSNDFLRHAAITIILAGLAGGLMAPAAGSRPFRPDMAESVGPTSASLGIARNCGTFRMPGLLTAIRVRARGPVSCTTARRVAISLFNRKRPVVLGWRCIGPQTGYSICRRGGATVTGTF